MDDLQCTTAMSTGDFLIISFVAFFAIMLLAYLLLWGCNPADVANLIDDEDYPDAHKAIQKNMGGIDNV